MCINLVNATPLRYRSPVLKGHERSSLTQAREIRRGCAILSHVERDGPRKSDVGLRVGACDLRSKDRSGGTKSRTLISVRRCSAHVGGRY